MKIRIKRFDKDLPLPEHKTSGAAAFDMVAREDTTIPAKGIEYVPLNVAIETPKGHFLLVAARSSLHKKGVMLANGIGVGDPDYAGDNDQYKSVLFNFSDQDVLITKGERIVQGMFIKKTEFEWDEVDTMGNKDRGGYGSTGTH